MASKRFRQDAKSSRARSINIGGRQSLLKKKSFKNKFDALLTRHSIFCDSNCGDEPYDDPSIDMENRHGNRKLTKCFMCGVH